MNPSIDELTDKAEMLEEQGDLNEALGAYQEALRYYRTPYLLYRYGSLALLCGNTSEARSSLLSAIEIAPRFPAPYLRLGVLDIDRGHYESAKTFLQKGLEVEEGPAMYTLLGVAQRRLGLQSEAIDSFRRAIEIDPAYEEAYYNLAVMISSERPDEAWRLLDVSLRLDPQYEEAERELGWVLRRLESYDAAEYHLRKAIELDSSDGWAYLYLGNLQWARNDGESAEETFKTALQVWPSESIAHWCLGMFYHYNDRIQEAEFYYDAAVRLDSSDPQANFRFGIFLKELGEATRAKTHLERVLQLDPENEEAKLALAEID